MEKFLKKIALFIVLFGLINIAFLFLVRGTDWDFKKVVEARSFNGKSYECLVLGNSLAFDALDTKLLTDLGISSYNLALDGATLETSYTQLQEYLRKNIPPKFIFVGLGSGFNDQNFDEKGIQPIVYYSLHPFSRTIKDNLPMVRYKWLGTALLKKVFIQSYRSARIEAGHLCVTRTRPDKTEFKSEIDTLPAYKYTNSEVIDKMASLCNEHKIQVILLEMPGFKATQNNLPFGPVSLISKSGHPLELYNLNNFESCGIFDSNQDWLGDSHLNISGAKKLTKEIYQEIILKDSLCAQNKTVSE